jgi:hypothetical protein
MLDQVGHYFNWTKAKRNVARCLKFKLNLKCSEPSSPEKNEALVGCRLRGSKKKKAAILRMVQRYTFQEESTALEAKHEREEGRKPMIKRTSLTYKLDPFIGHKGAMRVG